MAEGNNYNLWTNKVTPLQIKPQEEQGNYDSNISEPFSDNEDLAIYDQILQDNKTKTKEPVKSSKKGFSKNKIKEMMVLNDESGAVEMDHVRVKSLNNNNNLISISKKKNMISSQKKKMKFGAPQADELLDDEEEMMDHVQELPIAEDFKIEGENQSQTRKGVMSDSFNALDHELKNKLDDFKF